MYQGAAVFCAVRVGARALQGYARGLQGYGRTKRYRHQPLMCPPVLPGGVLLCVFLAFVLQPVRGPDARRSSVVNEVERGGCSVRLSSGLARRGVSCA